MNLHKHNYKIVLVDDQIASFECRNCRQGITMSKHVYILVFALGDRRFEKMNRWKLWSYCPGRDGSYV